MLQVFNYTLSHLITVNNGIAKIQEGNFRIIHVVRLVEYEEFLDSVKTIMEKKLPEDNIFQPSMEHELNQAYDMLRSIHPINITRKKRSINMLGTIWKVIAGTPDHDDFEILKRNINHSSENSNKQVEINSLLIERVNNITKITNEINKSLKNTESFGNVVAISIQMKLKIVKEELLNVKYAIQWAKKNVINSALLSKTEISKALQTLSNDKIPFGSIEEALEFSDIKVIYKNSTLFYLISIPLTDQEMFNKFIIRPVKKENKIVNINFKEIIKSGNKIYGIKNSCKIIDSTTICKRQDLVNISNNTCIPALMNNQPPLCEIAESYHIPSIEQLETDIILLNDFKGTLNDKEINGSYVIKFHNQTVMINGESYENLDSSNVIASAAVIQQTPLEEKFIEILSLEKLKQLHVSNTDRIKYLKTDSYINKSLIALVAVILLVIFKMCSKTTTNVTYQPNPPKSEAAALPRIPTNINNIPYF